jgi:hypothetical protein
VVGLTGHLLLWESFEAFINTRIPAAEFPRHTRNVAVIACPLPYTCFFTSAIVSQKQKDGGYPELGAWQPSGR